MIPHRINKNLTSLDGGRDSVMTASSCLPLERLCCSLMGDCRDGGGWDDGCACVDVPSYEGIVT